MRLTLTLSALALALSACAEDPSRIAAAPMPPRLGVDCSALRQEQTDLRAQLASLTKRQQDTRNADIIGIALVGLPIGRMTGGNVASQIATVKGQLASDSDALQACPRP